MMVRLSGHACMLSHFNRVQLFATLWTIANQTPLSMGFSRQEHWSGLPCFLPGELPDSGMESHLLCLLYWQAAPPEKPCIFLSSQKGKGQFLLP